jgi:hypothetical protein
MKFEELEYELVRLMSFPLKSQIKVDFDQEKKSFSLTVPIFQSGKREIPGSVQKYIDSRKGKVFLPHETSYNQFENQIQLIQQIPFEWGFQPTLRGQVIQFWEMARQCHKMLQEIAAEEKLDLFND